MPRQKEDGNEFHAFLEGIEQSNSESDVVLAKKYLRNVFYTVKPKLFVEEKSTKLPSELQLVQLPYGVALLLDCERHSHRVYGVQQADALENVSSAIGISSPTKLIRKRTHLQVSLCYGEVSKIVGKSKKILQSLAISENDGPSLVYLMNKIILFCFDPSFLMNYVPPSKNTSDSRLRNCRCLVPAALRLSHTSETFTDTLKFPWHSESPEQVQSFKRLDLKTTKLNRMHQKTFPPFNYDFWIFGSFLIAGASFEFCLPATKTCCLKFGRSGNIPLASY